jgi:LCP family protein required for cell wall assembly
VLSWCATVLSALVLVGSLVAYVKYQGYNANITRAEVTGNTGGAPDRGGAENFLVLGSDSRAGATAAELREAHTTQDGGGTNTDVMMVVHIAPGDRDVDFVSIPRDSWVNLPGHGPNKLNAAYALGGPSLLIKEIERLTGVHIDHFVMVNFFGFIDISDAVGGVRICVPTAEHDPYSGIDLTAGYHTISGPEALAFVRQRHGLPLGDLDRIRRQQEFIGAVIRKVETAGVLLDPFRLNDLLNAVTHSLTTDQGFSLADLRKLALAMHDIAPSRVKFLTYPVITESYYPQGPDGTDAVELNVPAGKAIFANILDNEAPTGQSRVHLTVPPAQIPVEVAAARQPLAAATAASLSAIGFSPVSTATAQTAARTIIRFGTGQGRAADTLLAALPGAVLRHDAALGSTLEVVLAGRAPTVHDVAVATHTAASPVISAAKDPCST